MDLSLDICEIYETLMGEGVSSGFPCTIIRLGGCNLDCTYCDTKYAIRDHRKLPLDVILNRVRNPYPSRVLVTGGEPLIQQETPMLLKCLLDKGHKVYLETNGSMDVSSIDPQVVKVMDLKCPASGQQDRNCYQNLKHLTSRDEIKFVIADRKDFQWARKILKRYSILNQVTVLFSPVESCLEPYVLAEWILKEELEVKFQIQLHKILWGEKRGI
jgi:7-carboxy-7-deazaguanine synthase